ncbi:MAG: TlyA family RNA methyltransferase [Acidobacteriota bacterium]
MSPGADGESTPASEKRRADLALVADGLAPTREKARALILAGRVSRDGRPVAKAGEVVPPGATLVVEEGLAYVSRGGHKLAHALDRFEVDPTGLTCLDLGASTGGFTDCLLQRGAVRVIAVDVGHGQLDWSLRQDDRVTCLEKVNARYLTPEQVGVVPELVTADLSFISVLKVLPALKDCAPGAPFVTLVKPQFEAGRREVGRKGVVRDPLVWRRVLGEVADGLLGHGWDVIGATVSPIAGPAGNREFLLHGRPSAGPTEPLEPGLLDRAVEEAITASSGAPDGASEGGPNSGPTRGQN